MFTQKTFETEFNQGKKSERAWIKIRNISDEICEKYGFYVIKNPQISKGKSHYEWEQHNKEMFTDVNSVNICKHSSNSWKSSLKREIDEVVKMTVRGAIVGKLEPLQNEISLLKKKNAQLE